jgi:hypothetical protein
MRRAVRVELPWLLACLLGGVALGGLWRLLVPLVTDQLIDPDSLEAAVTGDALLAGLGMLAGLVTAAALLTHPGPVPVRRFAVVMAGTIAGAALSWAVGVLFGGPTLRAVGAAFIWPVVTAGVTFAVTGLSVVINPGDSAPGDPGGAAPAEPQ